MRKDPAGIIPPPARPTKAGWRVDEWSEDTGVSRAYTYKLLAAGEITSVKVGTRRLITIAPRAFLESRAGDGEAA